MRFSILLVGLAATAAFACGGSEDDGGGGTAGKGGSSSAGTSSAGTSSGGTSNAGTSSGGTSSAGTSSAGTSNAGTSSGGTGSGTPGKVDSGVPDETLGSDLTDDQFDALCESIGKAAESVLGEDGKKATCNFAAYFATTLSGAMGAEAAAACKKSYDDCLAKPAEPSDNECTKPSDACGATVGEIEACTTDTLAQAKAAFTDLPGCDDLGTVYQAPADPPPPASCAVVEQKCPEALD